MPDLRLEFQFGLRTRCERLFEPENAIAEYLVLARQFCAFEIE